MRKLLFLVLSLYTLVSAAETIDKETNSALDYMSQGYMQYGFDKLKKIATANGIAAQYYVAACYEHGLIVEKNQMEAFKMYRKAAERGLPDAMYRLAFFYKNGIAVTQNSSKEAEWLSRYNQKGGKNILSDIQPFYREGLNSPQNFALNPNKTNENSQNLMAQNNNLQTINNITIIQQVHTEANNSQAQRNEQPQEEKKKSDVDEDIPIAQGGGENTFVAIIANENYQEVADVPFAVNDGETFKEYCIKALGIAEDHIRMVKNGTLNNIQRQIAWLDNVMQAYNGEGKLIFYYAGHGIPDEKEKSAYLLPVDGVGNDPSTGYSLDQLYKTLGQMPAQSSIVIMDACFSGAKRDGGMLASARGVAIKPKPQEPKGNMFILSAAQGDETAYPYQEKGHGMFTYYLLKGLQNSKGDISLGELSEYIIDNVRKQSIVKNGKSQTPCVSASGALQDSWKTLKLR